MTLVIVILIIMAVSVMFTYALCSVAKKADEQAEDYFKKKDKDESI